MTCVVGVVGPDHVVIAGDSAAVDGDEVSTGPVKVFRRGPYIIGYCESFRVGQVIRYRTKFSEQKCDDLVEHLATVFVDELRTALHKAGATSSSDPDELAGPLLVGHRSGRLFTIDTDYGVHEAVDGYAAIGCGAPYALGSLHATRGDPTDRAVAALTAATVHCTAVITPFTILTDKEQ